RAQTIWTTLDSANPVSLCVPISFEEDKHERGVVYNEWHRQRGGLGWKAPDMWFWLVINQ
uniref:ENR1 protein n=1 Tax=Mesocestoides corti TaxID=53468 RepID=A0A5K3FVX4_MESCO